MIAQAATSVRRSFGGLRLHGILSSSGWVLVGAIAGRGSTLLASILVARTIAPESFGRLTVMLTAVALISGVSGMGLGLAISRQVAETRVRQPHVAGRYIGSAVALTAAGGVAIVVLLLAARSLFADVLLQDRGLTSLVAAGAGAVLFAALNTAIQGSINGLESFRHYAIAIIVQGVLTGTGLVAGAAAGGATGALTGFAIGSAVAAAAGLAILHRVGAQQHVAPSYRIWPEETRRLFHYGVPTFLSFVAVSGAVLGGQLILSHAAGGYSEVALFSLAYRWHLVIVFVPACLTPVLVPMITRLRGEGQTGEVASIFRASAVGTLLLAGAPALVVAAAAPLLLGFSGGFYGDHPLPLIVLAAAAIPVALNNVLSSTSVGLGAMRAWLVSDLVLAGVVLAVAALLGASLQAEGLAFAYLAGYVATDLVLVRPVMRRLRA